MTATPWRSGPSGNARKADRRSTMQASWHIGPSIRTALLAGALAATAATTAIARDLREGVHTVTALGARSFAVTRWVDGPDGFHVLTIVDTLRPGAERAEDRHATVRLSTVLRPGQTQTIAVPEGPRGSAPSALEIQRVGNRVELRAAQPAVLTD
jgi:hypothetical protein